MSFTWNRPESRMRLPARSSLRFLCLLAFAAIGGQGCGSGSGAGAPADGAGLVGNGGSTTIPGGGGNGGGASTSIDASLLGGADGFDAGSTPACGQAGTPCCAGNICAGGGCCVSGICMAVGGSCVGLGGGVCKDGVCGDCGGAGRPCCTASTGVGVCTASSTVCSAGTCALCGGLGSPCCAAVTAGGSGTCNDVNAICRNNQCLACGVANGPCCPGDRCSGGACCFGGACTAEGATCGAAGGTCQAGQCSGCGNLGQGCCGTSCYDGLLCKAGSCMACGGLGQPCCSGTATCQAGMACNGTGGLCAKCGGLGDICCAGSTCAEGCCSGGHCLAPGTPACPIVVLDGGQPDAPMGGGGSGGAGGRGGAGGTVATGGTTTRTGGASGGGGVVGSGGIAQAGGAGGTSVPPWTPPVGCGDGTVLAPERCDDGNTVPWDGCSSDCQPEPICDGIGPCKSRCGDGLVVGEECDDGNVADGDGCSSACMVENGFACGQPALSDPILVPAVYRDFRYRNPTDFEATITGSTKASIGMVEGVLDAEGKPVYTGLTGGAIHVASKTSFSSWYRNTDGVNHPTISKLVMWADGSGQYVNRWGAGGELWPMTEKAYWCGYVGAEARDINGNAIPCSYQTDAGVMSTDCDTRIAKGQQMISCVAESSTYTATFAIAWSNGTPLFFPVDGDDFTPSSERASAQIPPLYTNGKETWDYDLDESGKKRQHNFSFTSEIRYWFKYDLDHSFRFDVTGDDDVWLFVNKQLVIDIGGIHTPLAGSYSIDSTTAANLGLVPGNVYEVAVFQAERQTTSSTLKIVLPGFNPAPSVCAPAMPIVRRR